MDREDRERARIGRFGLMIHQYPAQAPPLLHLSIYLLSFTQLELQLTIFPSRWWYANNHKPNKMAHKRRSNRPTARLVPRPRHSILLHELGIRNKRTRRRTTQHVLPYGTSLPNWWTKQESLSRDFLLASGASASKHDRERWR